MTDKHALSYLLRQAAGWGMLAWLTLANQAPATPLWNDGLNEIGSTGYLRAGGGVSAGQTQVCFKAPGAGAKYRLGNECEVYGRASVYYRHRWQEGGDAPYLHAEVQPEFNAPYGTDIAYQTLAQAYVEAGNLAESPLKLWAGRRYYKRRDIHLNDYFYMNLKGDGFGVRDIPLGFGDLVYTYLQMYDTPANVGLSWPEHKVAMRNHEIGLYNLRSNPGGVVMLDWRHAAVDGGSFAGSGGPLEVQSAGGWAFSAQHRQQGWMGGTNTVALQYGRGAARSAWTTPVESAAALARLTSPASAAALEAAETWRLVDFHLYEGQKWAMQSAFIWEKRHSARFDGSDLTWLSAGARPMWFIGGAWRLVGEAGYDRIVNHAAATRGGLWKVTAAIEWADAPGYFSRPALRAYLTRAGWSEAFRGQIGGTVFGNDSRGWSTGIQMESWW